MENRTELEKLAEPTVIGEVGHVDSGETLVARPRDRSYIGEQFRMIRTNLQFVLNKIEAGNTGFTSSFLAVKENHLYLPILAV